MIDDIILSQTRDNEKGKIKNTFRTKTIEEEKIESKRIRDNIKTGDEAMLWFALLKGGKPD